MKSKESRKAELLDRALQRMLEGKAPFEDSAQSEAGAAAGLEPLLDTASRVRILIRVRAPLPDFFAVLEGRLLKQKKIRPAFPARREFPAPAAVRWGRLRTTALIAAFTAVVMIGSGLGAASASAQALPGDTLYPVKRGFEEASLTFSFSNAGDVQLLADFADRRLAEVEGLVAQGRDSDLVLGLAYYEQTLSRLDAAVKELTPDTGSAQLDDLQAQLARHADVLSALRNHLPDQAQPALDLAVEHSQKSMDTVEDLRRNPGSEFLSPSVQKTFTMESVSNGTGPSATGTLEANPETTLPQPSRTPEATPTPEPTETPTPTESPEATKTPIPSDTPRPSKTPKPTDVAKPSDTPKPVEPTKPPKPSDIKPKDTPQPATTSGPIKIPTATPMPPGNTGADKIA